MRFRETNHLRKLANEMGKQMRGPRKYRITGMPISPERTCKNCDCRESSHSNEWALKNGTCNHFEPKGERP